MDKIWQKALNILMEQMFQKDNSLDSLTNLRQGGGSFNNLSKAIELLEKEKKSKNKGGGGGASHVAAKNEKDKKQAEKKAEAKFNEGRNHYRKKEFKKAKNSFEEALKIATDAGLPDQFITKYKKGIKIAGDKMKKQPPSGRRAEKEKPGPPAKKKTGLKKKDTTRKPKDNSAKPDEKSSSPSFAIIASYQLRKIKKSGKALIHLNQWRQESLAFRFDENIGGLDKYFDNPKFFRAVNLDDPVYKQREVVVMLDGQDAGNFKNYVNYVTVQIRKQHESGDMTHDELKIDKVNFNKNANNFAMIYGWKGDNNRSKWLSYKYKTRWSFHGGVFHEDQWRTTNDFVITVTPPHKYRKIILEADPEVFKEKKVRDASIKFYYNFYGKKMVRQATIRTSKKVFSKEIEYAHPEGAYDYEYEITWHLRGQKVLKTDRLKGSGDVIYCDELPEQNP